MITTKDILWGSYSDYEGPVFYGRHPFLIPDNPDEADRVVAVIATTEGANYSAINMYDSMIISVGLIQFGEANIFAVSDMLGRVVDKAGESVVLDALEPALTLTQSSFKKNGRGKWRFFFNDSRGEVKTLQNQRELFLGCSGLKGSWTPAAKVRARTWAAAVANVWNDSTARRAQVEYTRDRLNDFLDLDVKAELFNPDLEGDPRWIGAVRAGYLSFAANLPRVAARQYRIAKANLKSEYASQNWCIGLLKQLTFGPKIGIYPGRYDKIRPVLEQLWDVDLPKTSVALSMWIEPKPIEAVVEIGKIEAVTPQPEPIALPEPAIEPEPQSREITIEERLPQNDAPPVVYRENAPTGIFALIFAFIQMILSLLTKRK